MYSDYPTVYETLIDYSLIYIIILASILTVILIVTLISVAKVFKKANRSGISAIIPIYNFWTLLEIVNMPKYYLILMLIPIVNIFIYINITLALAKLFRKSKLFAVGLVILPFIFYPILAFGDSEYIGINIVAMEGKTNAAVIPTVVDEDNKKLTVNEEIDEKSQKMSISIGGGVYQKDYTKDLLSVDNKQAIYKTKNETPEIIEQFNSTFIPVVEEKEEPIPENDDIQSQITSIKPVETMNNENIDNISKPVNNINMDNNINQNIYEPLPITPQPTPIFENNETVICPKCGTTIKGNTKVCFLCGTTVR